MDGFAKLLEFERMNKYAEGQERDERGRWASGAGAGPTGDVETHHTGSHESGAKATIREIANPFRARQKNVMAQGRVDHPTTGVHEKWFESGPSEKVMGEAKAWAEGKMRGE